MSVVVVAGGPGGRVVDGLRGLVGGPVVVVTGGPGEFVVVLGSGPVVLDGPEESVV